jgi:hypothetical protein
MKMNRLKTGFDSLSDSDFETKSGDIYASMLDNASFPTPVPDLPSVKTSLDAYSAALIAAQSRNRDDVANKNAARETLTASLIQLANSVMTTANGDKQMLISSGFDLAKPGETTPLVKPEWITVTDGINPGDLKVRVKAVKGAQGYVPQYALDPQAPDSEWTKVMTTTCKYTFTSLTSGQKYWVRMAAIGPHQQMVYSDMVSRIAQ